MQRLRFIHSLGAAILFYIFHEPDCDRTPAWRRIRSFTKNKNNVREKNQVWITLSGLPLTIALHWPFHRSTSGADFSVLHGDIRVVGSEGLHAVVSVNLSATVKDVLPSLEPRDSEAPIVNALRKEVDRKQIEFVKSGKLLPVAFSSRHYDFKRQKWMFGKASDDTIAAFLERKVYWQAKSNLNLPPQPENGLDRARADSDSQTNAQDVKNGSPQNGPADANRIWLGDPTDAQYLETTPAHLVEIAGRLVAGNGLLRMEGEWAVPTAQLLSQADRFDTAMRSALEEIEKKHAFERG